MKYYSFESIAPQGETNSFLVSHDKLENERIFKANFSFDKLGDIDNINTTLTCLEGQKNLHFTPSLPWNSGKPVRAFLSIINAEIKSLLEQYSMPTHKWFNILVKPDKRFFSDREKGNYWMLQVLREYEKDILFSESQYASFSWNDNQIISLYKKGHVNPKNLSTLVDENFESQRALKPIVLCFKYHFDILWGSGRLIVNKKVRQAIESAGFGPHNGLGFKEFTDYQIIMPEE